MKFIFPALLSFVLLCFNEFASADDIAVRTLLSHGHQVRGKTCSDKEWNVIVGTIESKANRRSLRKGSDDRELWRAVPSYCEACCAGFPPGYCFLVFRPCIGYRPRRALTEVLSESAHHGDIDSPHSAVVPRGLRELSSNDANCLNKVRSINAALDGLYPRLSNTCRSVISESRDFTCYRTIDLDISKFRLWDGKTNKVIDHGFSRWNEKVCSSKTVNFEAVVGELVNKIAFTVTGNNGFKSSNTETGGPFLAFGDNNKGDVYGKRLRVGSYKLVATPDGDSSKTKTVKFNVIDC